jgi:4-hydroxybenzoate polyprenyltransferase
MIKLAETSEIRSHVIFAYLQLMRPANIITALTDILAGFAASGSLAILHDLPLEQISSLNITSLGWLLLSTVGLYGGGIVFNDVFDAEIDAKERPERPIPSGKVSRQNAALLGSILLIIALLAAVKVSLFSATIAMTIALCALLYDGLSKHHPVWGPLNMGMCRGGNLLLGVSAVPMSVQEWWFLALIPVVYIASITVISRNEVYGVQEANNWHKWTALILVGIVIIGIFLLGLLPEYNVLSALPFLLLFAWQVIPRFIKAAREPNPEHIRTAVKVGVLSLIILDATIAAGFSSWYYGLLVVSFLPVSITVAKLFAVT